MAKVNIEKQLFGTWLDLHFADQLNEDWVADLEDSLREAKKARAKGKRLLKKAATKYEELYGVPPRLPR